MKRAVMWVLWLVLRAIACLRPRLDIRPGGRDYLIRWYLGPTGKGRFAKWYRKHFPNVFLHCFLASDSDRGWHSHPWVWAKSLIMRGEYLESRPYDCVDGTLIDVWWTYTPGDVNSLTGDHFHKVKLLTPRVWTLFIVGPLHGREWEFLDEQGSRKPHGTKTPGD